MRVTDVLLGEHGVLYTLLEQVSGATTAAASVEQLRPMVGVLAGCIASHARVEDEQLLPYLEPLAGEQAAFLAALRRDHEMIALNLEELGRIDDLERLRTRILRSIDLVRSHFHSEEQQMFLLASRVLDESDLRVLGERWAEARGVKVVE